MGTPEKPRSEKIRATFSTFFFDVGYQKFSLLWLIIGFPAMLGLAVITTILTSEYSITTNWISDLGSIIYAPFPWLLDYNTMITAFFLISSILLLEKTLVTYPKISTITHPRPSRLRLHIGSFMIVSFFMGLIGIFGTGFFSEDRDYSGIGLLIFSSSHALLSWFAFGGIAMGFFFAGLLILSSRTIFPKILGVFCIIGPEVAFIYLYAVGGYISEWVLLFAFMAAFAPICLILLRELSRTKPSQLTRNKP